MEAERTTEGKARPSPKCPATALLPQCFSTLDAENTLLNELWLALAARLGHSGIQGIDPPSALLPRYESWLQEADIRRAR